ncbi:hypothetical protein [Clostridium cellulovorans]|uniref:Uncharacterized protein n=1 Tax=Clostridium cellulovorans (strain ATCC 35296 / DSM 3052 / OCM 3 / 743B) TaxID=573061 RepID=D9SSB7_CLOC7|nr:hypothetical protein [Clostridium cellulovorans]ADL50514.1 hypothetical protein Clocel_0743 [Clostridium cellulovorans 743B]
MSAFVLNRNYELQLPNSYADVDSDEMEYIDGGSAREWAIGIACSLIANAIWAIGEKAVSTGMVRTALTACAGAAGSVWAGIGSATAFMWNPPVAAAIIGGTVAVGVGVVLAYYHLR